MIKIKGLQSKLTSVTKCNLIFHKEPCLTHFLNSNGIDIALFVPNFKG